MSLSARLPALLNLIIRAVHYPTSDLKPLVRLQPADEVISKGGHGRQHAATSRVRGKLAKEHVSFIDVTNDGVSRGLENIDCGGHNLSVSDNPENNFGADNRGTGPNRTVGAVSCCKNHVTQNIAMSGTIATKLVPPKT